MANKLYHWLDQAVNVVKSEFIEYLNKELGNERTPMNNDRVGDVMLHLGRDESLGDPDSIGSHNSQNTPLAPHTNTGPERNENHKYLSSVHSEQAMCILKHSFTNADSDKMVISWIRH